MTYETPPSTTIEVRSDILSIVSQYLFTSGFNIGPYFFGLLGTPGIIMGKGACPGFDADALQMAASMNTLLAHAHQ
jgi:hypothetical protein